jgi:hypothetical protein
MKKLSIAEEIRRYLDIIDKFSKELFNKNNGNNDKKGDNKNNEN